MSLGISTACYFQKSMVEDAIGDISAHGVKLCECFLNSFSEYEPDFFSLLAERIQETGVKVNSIHPMSTQFEPQLFSIHPRQRNDAWSLFEQILCGARKLGAKSYVMHGPMHLSGAAKNISLSRLASIFSDLSDLAATYDVVLTLENVSWCVFCTPEFGRTLTEHIGPGKLKYTLDVKQAIRCKTNPLDFIEAVGTDIINVHLCDADFGTDGRMSLRLPGYGAYDFSTLHDALIKRGAKYTAIIEVYSDMYQDIAELYDSYSRMNSIFA